MKMKHLGWPSLLLALTLAGLSGPGRLGAQSNIVSSAFTFQGRLVLNGQAAYGYYDFVFNLYDQATNGNLVAGPFTNSGCPPWYYQCPSPPSLLIGTDAVVQATINFGSGAFTGASRWLGILVRSNGGVFTTLSPRQLITATPYATTANSLGGAGGSAQFNSNNEFLVTAAFTGINRSFPLSGNEFFGVRAPVTNTYGGMYVETAGSGRPFYGYGESGDYLAWTYLDNLDGNKWKLNIGYADRVTVTTAGNVGIGTTSPTNLLQVGSSVSPAYCDGGTWVNGSDRNAKSGLEPVNPTDVLEKLAGVPISAWHYNSDPGTRHLGPMAQDFYAAFGVGADDTHIATVDADGVALAAIQGLRLELQQKDAQIRELRERLDRLEKALPPPRPQPTR